MIVWKQPRSFAWFAIVVVLWLPAGGASGDDWPQWRGPERNGISPETKFLTNWPAGSEPHIAWRAQVGKGHSQVVVAGERAIACGWDGEKESAVCLDARTGAEIWRQSFPSATIVQWPGPRATPTVHQDRVFVLGMHGQLHAFRMSDGESIWSRAFDEKYQPDVDYGFSWSPLVEGKLLIFPAGRSGLAIHVSNGEPAWGDDGTAGSCTSAVSYTRNGKREVCLVVNNQRESVAMVGIDPKDGKQLWRSPDWPEKWGAACVDPVINDNRVFLTTAEQHSRGVQFELVGNDLVERWNSPRLSCYTGSCVVVDDSLYGVHKSGLLVCLDWKTGAVQWSQRGFENHSALVAVDGKLVIQRAKGGEIVVADADPRQYVELRRARIFSDESESFTSPSIANGYLYCRNYAGEVVCVATGNTLSQ